jgi:hypothetical protein
LLAIVLHLKRYSRPTGALEPISVGSAAQKTPLYIILSSW